MDDITRETCIIRKKLSIYTYYHRPEDSDALFLDRLPADITTNGIGIFTEATTLFHGNLDASIVQ